MTSNFTDLRLSALRTQKTLYSQRKPTPAHEYDIRSALTPNETDQQFIDLLRNAFGHHEISHFSPIPRGSLEIDNRLHVSKWFHAKYYQSVNVHQGLDPTNPVLPLDILFAKVTSGREKDDRNNVLFLVGPIGVGKSTFLCNFLYRNHTKLSHEKILPVRINVDVEASHDVQPLLRSLEQIRNIILNALDESGIATRHVVDEIRRDSRLPRGPSDESELDANIAHIVDLIRTKTKSNILLIIDNIDYLYHLGDRGFFST